MIGIPLIEHADAAPAGMAATLRRIIFALILLLIVAATSVARAEPPAVLILGDSLSSAHGMAAQQGWVSLLENRLEEEGYEYRVVNASVSGETSSGGRARLPAALAEHEPELVILELGGNDGLLGFPINAFKENLASLVETSIVAGAKVLLLGIQIPPNYGPVYAEQFAAVYPAIAERYGLALVPFLLEGIALDPTLMQPDGIHPTAGAQPLILDIVWPTLEPMLESQS